MSLCFRTLPARLSSFVSGRKSLSKLDRHQLQKHIESSVFLKQFLGTQRALSVRANATSKPLVPFVDYTLYPNLSLASLDTCSQWNEKLLKQCIADESKMMYWAQGSHRLHNKSQRLSTVLSKSRKHVVPIGITSDNVTPFQAHSVIGNDKNNSFLDINKISLKYLHNSRESNNRNILFTSDNASALKTSSQSSAPHDKEDKPSQEQLQNVVDCLSQDLPKLFVSPQNYSIYTQDLIFINNIRGVTTRGLGNYIKQLMLLRTIGHIKFAHVRFDVIKITMHTEDSTVKVRWRIRGITGWKVFVTFWKYKVWKLKDSIENTQELWYDGFSTYYVNTEGKVYKHVADKVMPDQDVAAKKDLGIATKLALFTGLTSMFDNNENFFELNSNLKLHQN